MAGSRHGPQAVRTAGVDPRLLKEVSLTCIPVKQFLSNLNSWTELSSLSLQLGRSEPQFAQLENG